MELPTGIVKAKSKNPSSTLIYAPPKLGKTTIVAALTQEEPNSLIISTEVNGYDFVDAVVVEALTARAFKDTLKAIEERVSKEGKYKYLIVDTCTQMDTWAEIVGTLNYMDSPMGKKFNRVGDVPNGKKIFPNSNQFTSVHEVGQGFGYRHSRKVMVEWFEQILPLADHVIFIAHVKDKLVSASQGETITSLTINLTGKVKDIYCARVDAIAMMIPGKGEDSNKRYLSFQAKDDSKFMGSRAAHLKGKILISESNEEKVTTHWNNIFIN